MERIRIFLLFFLLPATSQSQVISTYAGNGVSSWGGDGMMATSAEVVKPVGLNFDNSSNLIISHYMLVRRVNATTNVISRIAGSDTASGGPTGYGNGGPATCASVLRSCQTYVDEHDNYYIADQWSTQIRKVDAATSIITAYAGTGTAGSTGDGGPATNARFNTISCMVLDTIHDRLYIADEFNYKVRVVNMNTGIITTFAGTGTSGYIGDGIPATAAKFSRVLGLCKDRAGNLYIGDWDNARIRRIDISTGIVTTYVGSGVIGYFGDGGLATGAKIAKPTGLCMDTCDNLYFADEDNQVVRHVDAGTGIITTVAGNGTVGFSGDSGSATAAQFNHPTGVFIDNSGNLYISDYFNNRVRKMTFSPPVPPTVSVSISASPNDTVCTGKVVTYSATATGAATPSYQWYKNGTVVSTSGSTYTYTPANGDSVRCVATVHVCGSVAVSASSDMVTMEVTPLNMPIISITAPSATIIGTIVSVNAFVAGAGSSYSIKWYNNSVLFSTTTTPVTTYVKGAGVDIISAKVSSTDPTGCYDTATSSIHAITVIPNGVDEIGSTSFSASLYPNPVHGILTVSATSLVNSITVSNLMGQVLITMDCNSKTAQIDVANLPAGVYMVRINNYFVGKFVKQ